MLGFLRNLFAAQPIASASEPAPAPAPAPAREDVAGAAVKEIAPAAVVSAQPAPVRGPSPVMPRPRFGESASQGPSGSGMREAEGAERGAEPSAFWRPPAEAVPLSGGVVPVVPPPAFVASRNEGSKGSAGTKDATGAGAKAESSKESGREPAEAVAAAQALEGVLGVLVVEGHGIVLQSVGAFADNAVLYPALAGALERARISAAAMGLGTLDGFTLQAEGGELRVLAAGRRLLCVLSRRGVELEAGVLRRIADTLV